MWLLSSAGNLQVGVPLSGPSEEERGHSSAQLHPQLLLPIGQVSLQCESVRSSGSHHASPLQAAWEAFACGGVFLLSPEVAEGARDSGLQLIHPGPRNCVSFHSVSMMVGTEQRAEVWEAGETKRI